jgi:hypothetical protein
MQAGRLKKEKKKKKLNKKKKKKKKIPFQSHFSVL